MSRKDEDGQDVKKKSFNFHKGEWLSIDDCIYYEKKAKKLLDTCGQDIGLRRELRKEFQEKYGLLEIEAINILNGYYWIDDTMESIARYGVNILNIEACKNILEPVA